ncbi:hypothetical protein C2G38_2097431 [Gigaspora rosea]|uniref:Secreted protein n=1 Tax=Gigaspora rosea TaxID=44941 RepID=A0A397UYK7_9GLOM|nr:hypothetical protein C2G38_2097431 [Gigaspora rosea]
MFLNISLFVVIATFPNPFSALGNFVPQATNFRKCQTIDIFQMVCISVTDHLCSGKHMLYRYASTSRLFILCT